MHCNKADSVISTPYTALFTKKTLGGFNMSKIAPHILQLADKIEQDMELDSKTGIGKESGDISLYDKYLPDSLTPAIVQEVKEYDATFVPASTLACGRMANKAAAEDPNFVAATFTMKGGHKDTIIHGWDRQRTYANRLAGDGAEVTKHGVITTTFETRAGKNAGQLKSVREQVASMMEELAKS